MKKVVFRVDASSRIGTGHVVRCLTLAETLRTNGVTCTFVHRLHHGHMSGDIRARGFAVHELPAPTEPASLVAETDYAAWLGVPQDVDADETDKALSGERVDWIVVDHYGLDIDWESRMRDRCEWIAVVDDLANRPHDCDLLIDQNYMPAVEARYDGLVPDTALQLCGSRFALLRPEYAEARRRIGPRQGPLSRIFVFYGGADVHNETSRALRVLSRPTFRDLTVDVVIGVNNPHYDEIIDLAEQRPGTEVHYSLPHLVDQLIEADLALGAGGATTWERSILGLPSIVTAVAGNQVASSRALCAGHFICYLGHWNEVDDESLATALMTFRENNDRLAENASKAWRLTDGLGRLRIEETMNPTESQRLALRPADLVDKVRYFEWANDPDTRKHAHNSEPISWSVHEAWFDSRLEDPSAHLWVLVTPTGLPVGQSRTDLYGNYAVLSYSIDPVFRERGWGTRLLELTVDAWKKLGIRSDLIGEVRSGNPASFRALRRVGFTEAETNPATGVTRFRLEAAATEAPSRTRQLQPSKSS